MIKSFLLEHDDSTGTLNELIPPQMVLVSDNKWELMHGIIDQIKDAEVGLMFSISLVQKPNEEDIVELTRWDEMTINNIQGELN
ncbi:MAG TPA: hypothetical protein EYN54_12465 [Methylococcaceae bacterium]|nr:hypothetical protein [Methylococcaceae bacterium]